VGDSRRQKTHQSYAARQSDPLFCLAAPCIMRRLSNQIAMTKINPIDKHVGASLRMRRLMLNLTQEKMAPAEQLWTRVRCI
jgi:hypothetical protein